MGRYGYRRSGIDWELVGAWLIGLLILGAVSTGVVVLAQVPECYGVEPDGEVETLWPCPAPHKDGDRFQITEDQFESRELDD